MDDGLPAAAQSGTSGTISGVVRDESGGALPGVTATLTSPALQIRQIVQVTDATGNYQFVDLPAGTYRLTFELGGFSTAIREDLRLTVGFNARVDAALKVGAISESVTVTGQTPVIDVTSTTTSVTLTAEELNEIRAAATGAIYSMRRHHTCRNARCGGQHMANRQNIPTEASPQPKLQLEGRISCERRPEFRRVHDNDTLRRSLQTSGNDAEVMVPGVSMVAVIKSGGNDFHGRYGYAFQRPEFQSNNLDDHLRSQGLNATQPVKKFYDYQADLGGRILRDKLWFYLAYSSQLKETGITGFVQDAGSDGRYLTGDEPIAMATTGIDQFSMKYSYQISKNNRFNYVWQRGTKFVGEDGAGQLSPLEHTRDYTNPAAIARGEYQATIGSSSLFTWCAGYVGWWSDYSASASSENCFPFIQPI